MMPKRRLGAVSVDLSSSDVRQLEITAAQVRVQGARYPEHHQKLVGRRYCLLHVSADLTLAKIPKRRL
jgi:hypothetical protein